jgi:alkylation response protein AidB-like acyl-CoA dehydrogenase
LNFDLTPEQTEFQAVMRSFADQEVAPGAAERDRTEQFPLEVVRKMAGLGLFGLPFPQSYGGSEADSLTFCLAIEELGRVDQSVGITLSAAVGLGAGMINKFGTPEQKERWLAPACKGELLVSFGLTEPGGGSDAAAARTSARLEGDEWVIEGSKAFITNCGTPISGVHVVVAATEPGGGVHGLSTILVAADTAGVSVAPAYRKLGWRSSDTHELAFADCRVPADALLGERGRGFPQCLSTLADGRISVAALSVGLAQACLDHSLAYAKERTAFGHAIGATQAIQMKLADMRVRVHTARLATYHAAWLKDSQRPYGAEAAMAKLVASEAAVANSREAIQIFGGAGFMEESPVARFYRDAKVLEIGEGTSEIQRLLLAADLGLPPAY